MPNNVKILVPLCFYFLLYFGTHNIIVGLKFLEAPSSSDGKVAGASFDTGVGTTIPSFLGSFDHSHFSLPWPQLEGSIAKTNAPLHQATDILLTPGDTVKAIHRQSPQVSLLAFGGEDPSKNST